MSKNHPDHLIIPKLCEEIDQKQTLVMKRPEYHFRRDKLFRHAENEQHLYSWWLEHPEMRQALIQAKSSRHHRLIHANVQKAARSGAERLSAVWRHVDDQSRELQQDLDNALLLDIGRGVAPEINRYFRTSPVSIRWSELCPENAQTIPYVMDGFYERLKAKKLPVEAAIYAHVMIAGIQPLSDGNKRTARLVQNRILHDVGLPPIVIPPGERQAYMETLTGAIYGSGLHRSGISEHIRVDAMRPFFAYMAGKVNTVLDDVLHDLKVRY